MSNLLQFVGGQRRVTQIIGQNFGSQSFSESFMGARQSSVPFNGAYQTVLSVAGRGSLNFIAIRNSGFSGLRVTVDGRQIFAFSGQINGGGVCAIGSASTAGSGVAGAFSAQPVYFAESALVEALSSTQGAQMAFFSNYEVYV